MAGVSWKNKLKIPQDIKRQLRHCDGNCRLQDNHANENINKDLTKFNLQTCNYDTACKRFDDRIAYLESLPNRNKKADKVLAFGLDIPIPDGIPNSELRNFTIKVNEIIKNTTGITSDDIVAIYVHVDEVHDYIDSSTKQERTSMRHIHQYVIPNIDNKLNGKIFSSRKNMIAVNNAIEEMCQKDYGVPFMTGEKTKSNESVESLKLKSKALELDERENLVEQREEAVAHDEREVEEREKAVAQRESDVEAYDRITHRKREEADKKLSEAVQREKAVAKREASVQQAENAMVIQNAALQNRADELEKAENELKEKIQQERKEMLQDVERREAILKQRENNFKAEVLKEAQSIVEREKQATAKLEEFDKQKTIENQLSKLSNKFGSDEE